MPMSGPGAFGYWEENPGCPFPYQALARQKSQEYCKHVPIRGDSAKPNCIQSVFSSGLSSLQVRNRFHLFCPKRQRPNWRLLL